MAYFSNGTESECFDNECATCIYTNGPCPIAAVQIYYNYDAVNNKIATEILDYLVSNDGKCSMKALIENKRKEKICK